MSLVDCISARRQRAALWQARFALATVAALVCASLFLAGCASEGSGAGRASSAHSVSASAVSATAASEGYSHNRGEGFSCSPFVWTARIVQAGGAVPNIKLLSSIMGDKEALKLFVKALDDPDRFWIASHPETLEADGPTVQEKLLRLAADEDEAVTYVREFGRWYPDELDHVISAGAPDKNVADRYPVVAMGKSNVPHLYQWDQRWGYTVYSSSAFGMSGCGPTAFAMAYCSALGIDDFSPYDAALVAWEMGYMDEFEGTYAGFLEGAAVNLGLRYDAPTVDASSLRHALENGWVVIANVGHGYFSRFNGHYLVIAGLDGRGDIVLNDPYSVANSQRTWNVDFIVGQTMQFYTLAKDADEQVGMAGK